MRRRIGVITIAILLSWVLLPQSILAEGISIPYDTMTLEQLEQVITDARSAIEKDHSVSGSVASALDSRLKVDVVKNVANLESEPDWRWFDWTYTRDWEILTVTTEAKINGSWVPVQGKYQEVGEKEFVLLELIVDSQNVVSGQSAESLPQNNNTNRAIEEDSIEEASNSGVEAPGGVVAQNGDKGEAVTEIQAILINLGYLKGKPNGKFGDNTEKVVRRFQKKHGLTETGVVDEETYALLVEEGSNIDAEETPAVSIIAKKGDKNTTVKDIQEKLIRLGYLDGRADGDFGGKTEKAVMLYQAEKSLPVTGAVDDAMYEQITAAVAALPKPTPTPTPAPSYKTVDIKVLFDAYKANEIAADQQYKDKTIQFRGIVYSVEEGWFSYKVTIQTDEYFSLDFAYCSFDKDHLNEVANLRKGDAVVIRGKCTSGDDIGYLRFDDCRVVG